MYTIKPLPQFDAWMDSIKDPLTRARLARRLDRVQQTGILGNINSVGDGVWEMKEDFGPGWRLYYTQHGMTLIFMLCGGDKSTQKSDIARAKAMAKTIEKE